MFFYIDPIYLLIFIITLVISIAAQIFVKSSYNKWSKVRNGAGLSGAEVGHYLVSHSLLSQVGGDGVPVQTPELKKLEDLRKKEIITDEELQAKRKQLLQSGALVSTSGIKFENVSGQLTDHFDPRSNTARLSDGVAKTPSVSAMAIVAHELGHARQYQDGSILIGMRSFLVPAVRFSPQLAYIMILLGLIFNITGLLWLGVIFYALMVLFSILTLPVEIDASRRGLKLLREAGLMQTEQDKQGSRRVLTAAASTYIAAAVTAILQLLYYLSLARRRS